MTPPRLNLASLEQLPPEVTPRVDPGALTVGIVHLGIGAFHRAHQAIYTEDAIAAAGGDWGICGVTQRSPAVVEQLGPQDGLYTLAQRDGAGERLRVVGAVRELLWAQADADTVRERIAAAATRLVTLTVTEKGYHHDPATNRLALEDPAVAADLADGGSRTVVGQLAGGLAQRRRDDAGPVTVLCCDNLPDNGRVLRGLVADFVQRAPASDGLGDWIAANVTFPSTMVDRITPATTEHDLAGIAAALGARDEGAVVTEPFTPMGDRGRLRRRPAGVGARRGDHGRGRAPLRADQAAHAQRRPFGAGLSRRARRARARLRRRAVPTCRSGRSCTG